MPTFIALVPGIASGPATGLPSASTSCTRTPSRPVAFEYHAMSVRFVASVARFGSLPY